MVAMLAASSPAEAQPAAGPLVYHQITNLTEGSGFLGYPVLSADGTRAVFSDAPGTGDPETPNRIFTIAPDGSGMTEVDSYVPLCFCNAIVDISGDGATVVSSDSVQIRVVEAGAPRELLALASNEISVVRMGDSLLHRPAGHDQQGRRNIPSAGRLGDRCRWQQPPAGRRRGGRGRSGRRSSGSNRVLSP
jgi:hypothetical protein